MWAHEWMLSGSMAAAALLCGCVSFTAGREDALVVSVAAAEFRTKEGRWPADAEELLRSACRPGRVLGSAGPRVAAVHAAAAPRTRDDRECGAAFRPPEQRVSLRTQDDKLEIDVHNLRSGSRCRLVGRAPTGSSASLGGTVRWRTTLFACR
jgi:hypothetical protein